MFLTRLSLWLACGVGFINLGAALAQTPGAGKAAPKPGKDAAAAAEVPPIRVGQAAPDLLLDFVLNGKERSVGNFRGKVVVLDFWSVGSEPCLKRAPFLRDLYARLRYRGLEIISVAPYAKNRDFRDGLIVAAAKDLTPDQEQNMLTRLAAALQFNHRVALLSDSVAKGHLPAFGVRQHPHTVVLDRDGVVRLIVSGATPEANKAIEETVLRLLNDVEKPIH